MENQITDAADLVGEIIKEIQDFQKELDLMPEPKEPADRNTFTLLLSGISTCRKVPGISGHMRNCTTAGQRQRLKRREHICGSCMGSGIRRL